MKSKKLHSVFTKTLAVATLVLGLHAAPAAAATYDIGALSARPYAVNFVALSTGSFLDVYKFTTSPGRRVAASAVSNDALLGGMSFAHISNFAVSLYNDSNSSVSLGSWSGNPMNFVSDLDTGSYHFNVSGKADGIYGGSYVLSLADVGEAATVTAVPEPEQWALFAIGLAFLGLMGRRRATHS